MVSFIQPTYALVLSRRCSGVAELYQLEDCGYGVGRIEIVLHGLRIFPPAPWPFSGFPVLRRSWFRRPPFLQLLHFSTPVRTGPGRFSTPPSKLRAEIQRASVMGAQQQNGAPGIIFFRSPYCKEIARDLDIFLLSMFRSRCASSIWQRSHRWPPPLGDLIFVVGEDQILAAGMDVDLVTQVSLAMTEHSIYPAGTPGTRETPRRALPSFWASRARNRWDLCPLHQ